MNKLNNDLSLIFSDGLFSKTQISDKVKHNLNGIEKIPYPKF